MKQLTILIILSGCYMSHYPESPSPSMDGGTPDVYMCPYVPQNPSPCGGVPAGTTCRPSGGSCDGAEVCEGDSPDCPPDLPVAEGEPCCFGQCSDFECVPSL